MYLEYYFKVYNNILPKTYCDEVVAYAKQFNLEEGQTFLNQLNPNDKKIKKKSKSIRNSNIKFFNDPWIAEELINLLPIVNKECNWNFEYSISEQIQFTEYKKGQYYDFHPDSGSTPYQEGILKGLLRKISMSVNLTDRSKYVGGEFLFKIPTEGGEYITVTPENFGEKGSIVVFPSFVVHTVKPVIKGVRHSLVMWTNGKPFI